MISGERTKQLDIFCRATGFMSDFLRFIVGNLFGSFKEPFNYTYCIHFLLISEQQQGNR